MPRASRIRPQAGQASSTAPAQLPGGSIGPNGRSASTRCRNAGGQVSQSMAIPSRRLPNHCRDRRRERSHPCVADRPSPHRVSIDSRHHHHPCVRKHSILVEAPTDGERLLAGLKRLRELGACGTGVVRMSLSPVDLESRHWLRRAWKTPDSMPVSTGPATSSADPQSREGCRHRLPHRYPTDRPAAGSTARWA